MSLRSFWLAFLAAVALGGCSGEGKQKPSVVNPPRTTFALKPSRPGVLRLLQLNIKDGATDGRAAGVIAAIKASHADVVTLEEVTVESIFRQIATAVGYHGYYVPGVNGWSVGLLSRSRVQRCVPYNKPPMQRSAFGCEVRIARTRWWVFGAHLGSGFSDVTRTHEAGVLLHAMERHTADPLVLAGDLNSQTPGENDKTPLIIIPRIKRAGFTDSFREAHPSVKRDPGLTITMPPFGTPERRVDYVFHNNKARTISAQVISSVSRSEWPSDHAALAVTLAAGASDRTK